MRSPNIHEAVGKICGRCLRLFRLQKVWHWTLMHIWVYWSTPLQINPFKGPHSGGVAFNRTQAESKIHSNLMFHTETWLYGFSSYMLYEATDLHTHKMKQWMWNVNLDVSDVRPLEAISIQTSPRATKTDIFCKTNASFASFSISCSDISFVHWKVWINSTHTDVCDWFESNISLVCVDLEQPR